MDIFESEIIIVHLLPWFFCLSVEQQLTKFHQPMA